MGSIKLEEFVPDGYLQKEKIKNSIKALACNFLDFVDRRLSEGSKHIKILKILREKYVVL